MTIRFDKRVVNFTLSDMNRTNVDIWVAPYDDWHLLEEGYQLKKLNFTWEAIRFEKNNTNLLVQMNFS